MYTTPAMPSWQKTDRNSEKAALHCINHTNSLQRTLLRMSEVLKSQHPSILTIENHHRQKIKLFQNVCLSAPSPARGVPHCPL